MHGIVSHFVKIGSGNFEHRDVLRDRQAQGLAQPIVSVQFNLNV
jgi:hypothetical protein